MWFYNDYGLARNGNPEKPAHNWKDKVSMLAALKPATKPPRTCHKIPQLARIHLPQSP
jgi:hypothetical protein